MANKIWDKFKPISKKSKDYDIKENLVKAPKIENSIQNKNETQLSSKVLNIKTKSNKTDRKEINKANINENIDLENSYKNIENQGKDYRYIEESKKNEELIKKEKKLNIKESNLNSKEKELLKKENRLNTREEELNIKESNLNSKEKELLIKEEDFKKEKEKCTKMIQERMNLIDSQKEELNQFESELELKIINFNKSAKLYNKLGTFIIGTLVIVGLIFFIYK